MATEETIERSLPDEQVKNLEEDIREPTSLIGTERMQELRDEMVEIDYRTTEEGRLKCEIDDITSTTEGGSISVLVKIPWKEDPERFHFSRPRRWVLENDFVRFVKAYGYSKSTINGMKGEEIQLEMVDDDEFEIWIPPRTKREAMWRKVPKPSFEHAPLPWVLAWTAGGTITATGFAMAALMAELTSGLVGMAVGSVVLLIISTIGLVAGALIGAATGGVLADRFGETT